jgi:hypothetical protein
MEPHVSPPYSKLPAIGPYLEPPESIPYLKPFKANFNVMSFIISDEEQGYRSRYKDGLQGG